VRRRATRSGSQAELLDLAAAANAGGLALTTTAKDAARLRHGSPAARRLLERTQVLEIDAVFEPESAPRRIIQETLDAFRRR
jgi:tetraacyldisaccharide 4'-kinase